MMVEEQAAALVAAGKRAAEALSLAKVPNTYPRVSLGAGLPVVLVRAIAQAMGRPVQLQGYQGDSGPGLIEATSLYWLGVEIAAQGSRALAAEALSQPQAVTQ